jgi:putative ABC transport system permease protein
MRSPRWPKIVYRRLLVLYPPRFRALFDEELEEFFASRIEEARAKGRGAELRALAAALWDLARSSCLERIDERRRTSRTRSGRRKRKRGGAMDPFGSELKTAMRSFIHRPVISLAAVATIALAIAANTAVFTVVDRVLLRPLPYSEPERIAIVSNLYGASRTESSPPDFLDRKRESRLAEEVAAFSSSPMSLTVDGEARRVDASRVSAGFFDVFGVRPALGASGFPDEVTGAPERIAVLAYPLWQGAFGGDRSVVGKSLRLDGESYVVAGVMPETFDFPRGVEVFLPLVFRPEELADTYRGNEFLEVVARARGGVGLLALEREMDSIAARVVERVPERREFLLRNGWGASVVSLREYLTGDSRAPLTVLSAAVLVVLLLAAANVSHLLLSSAAAREVELKVRSSLGASRGRIFSQLVTESVVLSAAGAAVGLALAYALVRGLPFLAPDGVLGLRDVALDARALGFTVLVSLAIGILCGLAPAWQGTGAAGSGTSLRTTASRNARRLRSALVVSEVALALVLLVAGGLLVRSFERLSSSEPGFARERRLSFGIDFPRSIYPGEGERLAVVRKMLASIEAFPEVRSVGVADRLPLGGRKWTGTFRPEGYTFAAGESIPGADLNTVGPGYLQAMGIPLSSGRDFTADDDAQSPGVVLVDEWLEKRFWPEGALGKHVDFGGGSGHPDLREIVGVVGHVQYEGLGERGRFQITFPWTQNSWRHLDFVVAANVDPSSIVPRLRREVGRVAPDLAVQTVRGLDSVVADTLSFRRVTMSLIGGFGLMALLLTAIGIYGVLSYSVVQRRREVGLRMALGATRASVLASVVREGLLLALVGVGMGSVGSVFGTRLLSSLLYGVGPADAPTYGVVLLVVSGVAVAATLAPAWRASRLDPLTALRME